MRKFGVGGRVFSVEGVGGCSLLGCAGVIEGGDVVLGDCGRGSPAIPSDSFSGSRVSGGGGSGFSESEATIGGSLEGDRGAGGGGDECCTVHSSRGVTSEGGGGGREGGLQFSNSFSIFIFISK